MVNLGKKYLIGCLALFKENYFSEQRSEFHSLKNVWKGGSGSSNH